MPPRRTSARWRWFWVSALGAVLAAAFWWLAPGSSRPQPPANQVQRHLDAEDWPAVLACLAVDPLTNAMERLAAATALFETGRLPEDLFCWIHQPGPDLLSTVALRRQLASIYAARVALELGHVNVAERWAYDSLEMEGESPAALRALARIQVLKGMPQAARIFLNRLEAQPAHRRWATNLQAQLDNDPEAAAVPEFVRIRSNLVVNSEIGTRLFTEILLRQAYEAHRENDMAFQFLMAQQLLTRRVVEAVHTLADRPMSEDGPLPRHYAEAVILQHHLSPGSVPVRLRKRVPASVAESFDGFKDFMRRDGASAGPESQPRAWRDFGDTYWYYHFYGPHHRHDPSADRPYLTSESRPSIQSSPVRAFVPAAMVEPGRLPRIVPDYMDVVIPPNLAPLNLSIQEPGTEYRLRLWGPRGSAIEVRQPSPQLRIPSQEWKRLLELNRGEALRWDVAIRDLEGNWITCAPFTNRVADEAIDSHLVYRRLQPLFSYYRDLGIYQRDLESFEEKPILRNAVFDHGCVNCHTPAQGAPDRFVLPLRTQSGAPTLLVRSNIISRLDQKMGYSSWHPNGRLIAFSVNTISQFFHISGPVNRDIYDPRSDLALYHVDEGTVEKPPAIAQPDHAESWPSWAPDGRHLYFSRAPALAIQHHRSFRYDLLRIPYDPDLNQWGEPETLFAAADHRLSAHQPRVSPDGQLLVFTVSDSGSFPVFRSNSDLFLLRLDTRELLPLPINSDVADTWHCWSSDGRWLVFGSKRLDGVFTRVFISKVDSATQFSKPLLLPQEDPAFYDTCLDNFNMPELVAGPLQVSEADMAQVLDVHDRRQSTADSGLSTESEDDSYQP